MNKERKDRITEALTAIETAKGTLEMLSNELQDEFDDLSEGAQEGPTGEKLSSAISSLEDATTNLENAIDSATSARDE